MRPHDVIPDTNTDLPDNWKHVGDLAAEIVDDLVICARRRSGKAQAPRLDGGGVVGSDRALDVERHQVPA